MGGEERDREDGVDSPRAVGEALVVPAVPGGDDPVERIPRPQPDLHESLAAGRGDARVERTGPVHCDCLK